MNMKPYYTFIGALAFAILIALALGGCSLMCDARGVCMGGDTPTNTPEWSKQGPAG